MKVIERGDGRLYNKIVKWMEDREIWHFSN